jgi:hypothetical protein
LRYKVDHIQRRFARAGEYTHYSKLPARQSNAARAKKLVENGSSFSKKLHYDSERHNVAQFKTEKERL